MKYFSLDLETTGLDPRTCQVLEVGIIEDDLSCCFGYEDCRKLRLLVRHEPIIGDIVGIRMNAALIAEIEKSSEAVHWDQVEGKIREFIGPGRHNVAGKNFGTFDSTFLPFWRTMFRQRVIDPAMFYLKPDDLVAPDLGECLKRAGIERTPKHSALSDAWDVICLIREHFELKEGSHL